MCMCLIKEILKTDYRIESLFFHKSGRLRCFVSFNHEANRCILNKSETLHYNILYFARKYWTKSINLRLKVIPRYPANDSSKLHQFFSFDVWVVFLFVFKLYSLNFAFAHG